jgi:hypothetical protein
VGSYGEGFGYIDPDGRTYHPYPAYRKASGFAIATSKDGEVWIATMGQGLLRINTVTNQLKAYTMAKEAPNDPKTNSIVNDYISKMSLSPDGRRVYCATTLGLCCLDIETESWTSTFGRNCLNYGTPCRVVKEYGGRLWIGTNDGLFCYDMLKKKMETVTTEKGLADNGIASIEQDKAGRLWIGTDHGLCCYDPKTGLAKSYFVDNGLQSNEFSDGASCGIDRGDHALIIMGGVGGITWFDPAKVEQARWEPTVKIVSFLVKTRPSAADHGRAAMRSATPPCSPPTASSWPAATTPSPYSSLHSPSTTPTTLLIIIASTAKPSHACRRAPTNSPSPTCRQAPTGSE